MKALTDLLKRYPVAIICTAVFILGLVVIFLRGDALSALQAEEQQLSTRIRLVEANARNANGIEEELEELEALVALIEARAFNPRKRAINTNFFYSFSRDLDVTVTQVNERRVASTVFEKGGPHELELHSTITYDISAVGSYKSLVTFLHKFLVVDAIARVPTITMSPAAGDVEGGEPQINLSMQVVVLAAKN